MASKTITQCSSSSHEMKTYDVFVSFRGEDTRNNFTAFLFEALSNKGINAFRDDKDIRRGESLTPELLQAIEKSKFFVVVFSKNYASSTWCLRELAEIWGREHVLPVFYDVEPPEVRYQRGNFLKAFAKHEDSFRKNKKKMEEVQRWREVLTDISQLAGWEVGDKSQPEVIKMIVKKIVELKHKYSNLPKDYLVEGDTRVEELTKLIQHVKSVNGVRVIGICGMCGIGKTTLGYAFFEKFKPEFDSYSFIDVKIICERVGKLDAQKELLSTTPPKVKALAVFDNADQVEPLEMFEQTRLHEYFGQGSIVIIISSDEQILKMYNVKDVYRVQELNYGDAMMLFCKKAFQCNGIKSGYEKFSNVILSHVQGHPSAIKSLGFSLFGRDLPQWEDALARPKQVNKSDSMEKLKAIYEKLEPNDKEIFLDIACFFKFYPEENLMEILDFRGFQPKYGLGNLADKSLITRKDGLIQMHDLLAEFGKDIIRQESPKNPSRWSRLWDYQNLHKVMLKNEVAENLEAIIINYVDVDDLAQPTIGVDALSNMSRLKLLTLNDVNFSGDLNNLSSELGYLNWSNYHLDCLPPNFQPYKLVDLSLTNSNIKQLWKDTKLLPNLKRLNLSHSKNLIEMPNFGEAPKLERIILVGCIQLSELDPSTGDLSNLTGLNLKDCKNLIKLPNFKEDIKLEILNLEGCIKLKQIHPSIGNLKELVILNLKNCTSLESLPDGILGLISIEYLGLSGCSKLYNTQLLDKPREAEHLKKLPLSEGPTHSQSTSTVVERWLSSESLLPSSPIFSCMRQLDLSFCNLLQIPDVIGKLHSLERLNLRGNYFTILPDLKKLSKLYYLNLQHCKQLKRLTKLSSRMDLPLQAYMPRWLVVEPLPDEIGLGLNLFNCPELVERQNSTSMILSWIIQIVQADHHCKNPEYTLSRRIETIVPGSEIPNWFDTPCQGMDNLMRIDTSPVKDDNNWIGIACCAIFVVKRGATSARDPLDPEQVFTVNIPVVLSEDLVTHELDHMWLFYFPRTEFIDICESWTAPDLGHLDLELEIMDRQGFHVVVKKHTYRWVYEQDAELSKLTMNDNAGQDISASDATTSRQEEDILLRSTKKIKTRMEEEFEGEGSSLRDEDMEEMNGNARVSYSDKILNVENLEEVDEKMAEDADNEDLPGSSTNNVCEMSSSSEQCLLDANGKKQQLVDGGEEQQPWNYCSWMNVRKTGRKKIKEGKMIVLYLLTCLRNCLRYKFMTCLRNCLRYKFITCPFWFCLVLGGLMILHRRRKVHLGRKRSSYVA